MARRAYAIGLDPKHANPEDREGPRPGEQFRNLHRWIIEQRGRLVAAALTLCRAWWTAGRPEPGLSPFGSFETWQRCVGGVLSVAGVEGFLANRETFRGKQDEERLELERFLRAILRSGMDGGPSSVFTSRELAQRITAIPELEECMPAPLAAETAMNRGSLARVLGTLFGRIEGRRVAADGLRLERGPDDRHSKVAGWRVVTDE
jgi:hypothetical protein